MKTTPRAWLLIALVACACGAPPKLALDRESVCFIDGFGHGTKVGSMPQQSILVTNAGGATLVISSATVTGDPAFRVDPPTKTSLPPGDTANILCTFAPTAEREHTGTLVIVANGDVPMKSVPLSGRGTDGGS